MPVALEYYSDHVLIRMVGAASLSSLRRSIVVPYSDIAAVEVAAPEWPTSLANRVGTHLPRVVASGTFMNWKFGERRFLHFDRKTSEVLKLDLAGHPDFIGIQVEVKDPRAARVELDKRRRAAR